MDTHVLYRRRIGIALFTAFLAPVSAVALVRLELRQLGHGILSIVECLVPAILLLFAAGCAWALACDHRFDVCPTCHPGRKEPLDRHPVWQDWFLVIAGSLLDDAPWMTGLTGLVLMTAFILFVISHPERWFVGLPLFALAVGFFSASIILDKRQIARRKADEEEIERLVAESRRSGSEPVGSTSSQPKEGGR